jgi:hypothetical protein
MGFDKPDVIYGHHQDIMQNSFTALNTLGRCHFFPLFPESHLHSFDFSRTSYSWNHRLQPFQTGFSPSGIRTEGSPWLLMT